MCRNCIMGSAASARLSASCHGLRSGLHLRVRFSTLPGICGRLGSLSGSLSCKTVHGRLLLPGTASLGRSRCCAPLKYTAFNIAHVLRHGKLAGSPDIDVVVSLTVVHGVTWSDRGAATVVHCSPLAHTHRIGKKSQKSFPFPA